SQKPAAFQKLTGNEQDRNRKASVFGQRPPPAGFSRGERPPPAGCCCCRFFPLPEVLLPFVPRPEVLLPFLPLRPSCPPCSPPGSQKPAASSQQLSYAITEKELN